MWSIVIENKEWIFSGIGVTLLGVFFSFLKKNKPNQIIKSGSNSLNIQSGGNSDIRR